ncbi:GNAT family N-acetyltransferase [Streptomyces albidus (ex Kaewkla and Franco 2022)]|uniref:GNAT family N-acetyltransferase n=1 Tax=Streptomyces albidus (ex Kaewkla and Franco 2022) TaxID=722709 RepID=UPI0015EFC7DD|nr:GNAT family N-acetyltransferase [Streptomyces albidus (ex Kaewkla and Franco 2022)]
MDPEAVLAQFDARMRQYAPADGTGSRVERVGDVVRQVGADRDWNGWTGVIWSDVDADTADAAIQAQVGYFTAEEREFEWKLYAHDRPHDLGARLEAAGFTPEPQETLMVAEAAELSTEVRLPEGVRLCQVTEPAELDLVTDVHEAAFGEPDTWLGDQLRAQLAESATSVVVVVAMAGEVPVSAARLELLPGTPFAGLWGGGTVPEWRGRGIYRALIAYRARIAAECGYRYLQVDASSESSPILRRLGFAALSTTTPYVYRP